MRALGSWKNPPLAYVVAELAISAHYGLAARIPALQESLRDRYPRTSELSEILITNVFVPQPPNTALPLPQSPQQRWHLLDTDNTRAVDVSHRAIGLHATVYEDSTDFLERWERVLTAIEQSGADVFVERIGLRYVDMIVPSDGYTTADYLVASLRGPSPLANAQVHSSIWAFGFAIDGTMIQVRTATPAPVGLLLPPNLSAVALQMPKVLLAAQANVAAQKPIGWIDTDAGRDVRRPLRASELLPIYADVHRQMSLAFQSLLSDHARREWE